MQTILAYFRLFRLDAALIAFFAYLVGASLGGGLRPVDALIALAVSVISMNFVYSFNSWADREIDAINKQQRPIPSGQISPRAARNYALLLLGLSLVYPLLLCRSPLTLGLFWLLPLLGTLYSAHPFRLKRHPVPAAITTSLILVTPMLLGYVMHDGRWQGAPFFVALFVFCLGAIPLKDIEDVEGDGAMGCGNWLARLGSTRLLAYAMTVMAADIVFVAFAPIPLAQRLYLWTFAGGALITIAVFWRARLPLERLYRTIIRVVIVTGVGIFALQLARVI